MTIMYDFNKLLFVLLVYLVHHYKGGGLFFLYSQSNKMTCLIDSAESNGLLLLDPKSNI